MVQISIDADDLHDNLLCVDVVVKITDVDKMVNLLVRIESSGLKRNGGAVQRSTSDQAGIKCRNRGTGFLDSEGSHR